MKKKNDQPSFVRWVWQEWRAYADEELWRDLSNDNAVGPIAVASMILSVILSAIIPTLLGISILWFFVISIPLFLALVVSIVGYAEYRVVLLDARDEQDQRNQRLIDDMPTNCSEFLQGWPPDTAAVVREMARQEQLRREYLDKH